MKTLVARYGRFSLVAFALCAATPSQAGMFFLKARLDPAQAGAGITADGAAFLTYDDASGTLTWTINYESLSGAAVDAHLRGPGTSGTVVSLPLSASPLTGSTAIAPADEADLLAGNWSIDIDTAAHPSGEEGGAISQITTTSYEVHRVGGDQPAEAGGPIPLTMNGTATFDPATLQLAWNILATVPIQPIMFFPQTAGFRGPPAGILGFAPLQTIGTSPATLTTAQAANVVNGRWYYVVTGAGGPGADDAMRGQLLPADTAPHLANLSTRAKVLTGDNVMIAGFIVGGTARKTVGITATGPSLVNFGIADPLANPTITLVRQTDHSVVATNDDWNVLGSVSDEFQDTRPPFPLESSLVETLDPGAYTVIVSGVAGGTGVGVIGLFELDRPDVPLVNISTRGEVLTGDDAMIAGFIVQGSGSQKVAITATGPSLAAFGIANPLMNPMLTIVRSSDQATIATNDDWQSDVNAAQLTASGFAPTDSREAGLVLTLPAGAYTAIVRGAGGVTGVSVVGVFALP